jgi:hypothetical protein
LRAPGPEEWPRHLHAQPEGDIVIGNNNPVAVVKRRCRQRLPGGRAAPLTAAALVAALAWPLLTSAAAAAPPPPAAAVVQGLVRASATSPLDLDAARHAWQQALTFLEQLGHSGADQVRARLRR